MPTDITKCSQSPTAADNANFKFLVCNPATNTPYQGNIIPTGSLDPTAVSKVVSMAHPYSNDPTEFPGGVNPFPTLTFTPHTSTASFLALNQVSSFDAHFNWPVTYQINAGFQQEFGHGFALTMNYVGSLNRKLPIYHDLNPPQFNITAAGTSGASCTDLTKACGYANTSSTVNNRRVLNSQFGLSAASPTYSNVYNLQSSQNSNYNGLQVNVEKRLSQHFSARGFYIFNRPKVLIAFFPPKRMSSPETT
jgi:hypothetical protein